MASHPLSLTLRPLQVADIPAVMDIEEESFPVPWPAHAYQRELTDNDLAYCLALQRDDGTLLGYGCIWLIVDEVHISTIAVAPDWRGYGLGELILIALIEAGIARGGVMATLEVRVSNLVAQTLYAKLGFEVVGFRKAYYTDNHEDALIMTVEPLDADYRARLADARQEIVLRLQSAPSRDPDG